jgi:nitroreductase
MNDSVSSGELFLNIVSSRRSMRDFKPDAVPKDIIASIFGGAQRAPE